MELYVPHEDLIDGRLAMSAGRLTARHLAPLIPHKDRDRQARELVEAIGKWDWAIDESLAGAKPATNRAAALGVKLAEPLSKLLTRCLSSRVGQRLEQHQASVWLQLVARGIRTPGVQICDWCGVVFTPAHADGRRCPQHAKSKAPVVHAVRDGGWHIDMRIQLDGSVVFVTQCQSCDARFETSSSKMRHCEPCSGPTNRSRRSRSAALAGLG